MDFIEKLKSSFRTIVERRKMNERIRKMRQAKVASSHDIVIKNDKYDKDNGIYIFAGDIPIMKVTSDKSSPNHMDMERASIYLNKVKEMYVNYTSGNKIESNNDLFNLL